jgi:hypothetical protein
MWGLPRSASDLCFDMTTMRGDYLAAAHGLHALAEPCDDELASDLKNPATRARLKADCLIHPESKAWALLKQGKRYAPAALYGLLVDARSMSKRFDILANLVEEVLKKHAVAPDDPFRSELAERLADEMPTPSALPTLQCPRQRGELNRFCVEDQADFRYRAAQTPVSVAVSGV